MGRDCSHPLRKTPDFSAIESGILSLVPPQRSVLKQPNCAIGCWVAVMEQQSRDSSCLLPREPQNFQSKDLCTHEFYLLACHLLVISHEAVKLSSVYGGSCENWVWCSCKKSCETKTFVSWQKVCFWCRFFSSLNI